MEDIHQYFLFNSTQCNPVLYLAAVVHPPRGRRRPSWPACSGHWLPYSGRGDGRKAAPPSPPRIPHLNMLILCYTDYTGMCSSQFSCSIAIFTHIQSMKLCTVYIIIFFKPHPCCTSCTWVVLNHAIGGRLLWYIRETLDIIVCHRYSCVLGLWSRCFSHRGCRRFPLPFQCRSRLNRLLQFLLRLITNLQYKASKNIRFIL